MERYKNDEITTLRSTTILGHFTLKVTFPVKLYDTLFGIPASRIRNDDNMTKQPVLLQQSNDDWQMMHQS